MMKLTKRFNFLVPALLAVVLLGVPAVAKTVRDVTGTNVSLPEKVERLAVTAKPWASVIWGLDGGSARRLVSINPDSQVQYRRCYLSKLDPEFAVIPSRGIAASLAVNVEEMATVHPDVIFLWGSQLADVPKMRAINVTPVVLKYATDLKQLCANFEIVGAVLGREEVAGKMIACHQATERFFLDSATALKEIKPVRVLFLQDIQLRVAGAKNVNQYLLAITGAQNVAEKLNAQWPTVNMEQILTWDPEVIYLSCFNDATPEDFYKNRIPGQYWSGVSAVKNHRVYKTPAGVYNWDAPCLETPLMLKWYGKIQHPDLFAYSFSGEVKSFYKRFFNISLTDADVRAIIHEDLNGPIE